MTIQDDFKADIEAFLTRHDMKPAVFGTQALKDPKFVFDLREGRSPSLKTIDKVRAWIESYEGAPAPQAPNPETAAPEAAPEAAKPARKPQSTAWPQQGSRPAPARPASTGGLRRKLLWSLAVIGVIAFAAIAIRHPGGLYRLVAGAVGSGSSGASGDQLLAQFRAVTDAMQGDFNDLRQRLDRLEAQVDGMNGGGAAPGDSGTADLKSALTALTDRVAALEEQAAKPAAVAPDSMSTQQLSSLEDEAAANRSAIGTLKTDMARLDDQQAALATAQAEIASLKDEVASLKAGLDQLNSGVGGVGGLKADIERSTAVAAFLRLDGDARAGRPYRSALALYETQQAAHPQALPPADALSAHAETGVASAEALTTDFEALEPQLLAAREEGGSWSERLMSRLKGIVVIQRTGDVSGDSPDAIVARAERAVKGGDIDKALMELRSLSPDRQALAAAWVEKAEARRDALKTLSDMAAALSAEGS